MATEIFGLLADKELLALLSKNAASSVAQFDYRRILSKKLLPPVSEPAGQTEVHSIGHLRVPAIDRVDWITMVFSGEGEARD